MPCTNRSRFARHRVLFGINHLTTKPMKNRFLIGLLAILAGPGFGQVTPLRRFSGSPGALPQAAFVLGTKAYFSLSESATSNPTRTEFWETDGSPAGTRRAGVFDGQALFQTRAVFANRLFFVTWGQHFGAPIHHPNQDMWVFDGTAVTKFREFEPGTYQLSLLTPTPTGLYFLAQRTGGQTELWRSDGTPAGATVVRRFERGPDLNFGVTGLVPFGNDLLFVTGNQRGRQELWRTDGTEAGTRSLGLISHLASLTVQSFTDGVTLGGVRYFAGADAETGTELWRTDGTPDGTFRVADLRPGTTPASGGPLPGSSLPGQFAAVGSGFYFVTENQSAPKLWRSDGTEAGTRLVRTFGAGRTVSQPRELNGRLLFLLDDPATGAELWISDGTEAGTQFLRDAWPGTRSAFTDSESFPPVLEGYPQGNLFFFLANDGQRGKELWRTDGTPAGTRLVADHSPGAAWTFRGTFQNFSGAAPVQVGDRLLFVQQDRENVPQLAAIRLQDAPPVPDPPRSVETWYREFGVPMALGSTSRTWVEDLALDRSDHAYVSGKTLFLSQGMHFYDAGFTLKLAGSNPSWGGNFVARYDPAGTLRWAQNLSSSPAYEKKTLLAVDPTTDELLVAGAFDERATIGGQTIQTGQPTFYLARFDSLGRMRWISPHVNNGLLAAMQVDGQGNTFVAGRFSGNFLNLGPNARLESRSSPTYFVAQYDARGQVRWARTIEGFEKYYGKPNDLKLDAAGRVYVLISQSTDRTGQSCRFTDNGLIVTSFEPDGSPRWQKKILSDDLLVARSLALLPTGEVLVAGRFRGTLRLDRPVSSPPGTDCSQNASFLLRLNGATGTVLRADAPEAGADLFQVHPDPAGGYYTVSIHANPEGQGYPGFGNGYFSKGKGYYRIRRHDYLGQPTWERTLLCDDGTDEDKYPRLAFDRRGEARFADVRSNPVDSVANGSQPTNVAQGFLMRFALGPREVAALPQDSTDALFTLAPNPTAGWVAVRANDLALGTYDVRITTLSGQVIANLPKRDAFNGAAYDLSALPPGLYVFTFTSGTRRYVRKVVRN